MHIQKHKLKRVYAIKQIKVNISREIKYKHIQIHWQKHIQKYTYKKTDIAKYKYFYKHTNETQIWTYAYKLNYIHEKKYYKIQ